MKRASLSSRAVAVLIDGIVVVVGIGTALSFISGEAHSSTYGASLNLSGGWFVLWLVLAFGYWIVCEAVWGRTLGKRATNVTVVMTDGTRVTWRGSIIRNMLRAVDGFPYVLPYVVGFFVAIGNERRRRLGDLAGRTVVIEPLGELERALLADDTSG